MAVTTFESFRGTRLLVASALVGGVGLLVWVVGAVIDPARAFPAWLTAFTYVSSLALGGLLFLMIGYTTGARWMVVVRRMLESIAGPFVLLLVAFVPVVVGAEHLYMWVSPPPDVPAHVKQLLAHKAPYLNLPFFTVRGVFYLVVWAVVAFALRRWSRAAELAEAATGDPHRREKVLSAALLPVVGLTLTFASFDWLMSRQPEWFGTMFGIYYFAGGFVGSLGLLTLLTYLVQRSGLVPEAITPHHFHALGRLLFGFSIFWAYIAYFQGMLTQIADKPEEVMFFVPRLAGGWEVVVWLLIIGRFALPFFLLLPRAIKFHPPVMAAMGAWSVAIHYVDVYWLVVPLLEGRGPLPNLWDVAALAGLAGLCVAFVAWRLRGGYLVPARDPLFSAGVAYRSPL